MEKKVKKERRKKVKKAKVTSTQGATTTQGVNPGASATPVVKAKELSDRITEAVLAQLKETDNNVVKMTGNTVRAHQLLCGEDPRYLKHTIGVSLINGQIMSVPTEHANVLINISTSEDSNRKVMRLCLMDTGASTTIISLKIVEELGVKIYESPCKEMSLTDASGQSMNIVGWPRYS